MKIAEYLRAQGRTLFIDTDLEQHGYEWAKLNHQQFDFEHLDVAENDGKLLEIRLEKAKAHFDFIVLDIDGHDTRALRSVLKHADKLMIPVSQQAEDVALHANLLQIAMGMLQYNSTLQIYSLQNAKDQSPTESDQSESQKLLSNLPNAHFLNTIVYREENINAALAVLDLRSKAFK